MFVATAGIEKLIGVAGQIAQALHFVFHGMRVDDVHNDGDAMAVGRVDEQFQLFRGAEARGSGKERADMIAEAAIVGMFLYGHDLNAVVAVGDDSG